MACRDEHSNRIREGCALSAMIKTGGVMRVAICQEQVILEKTENDFEILYSFFYFDDN